MYKYFYLQKVIIFSDPQLLQALRRGFCRAGADLDGEAAAAVERDGAALQDGDRVGQAARGAGSARGVPHPARQQPPQVKILRNIRCEEGPMSRNHQSNDVDDLYGHCPNFR